ncbi:hypothetical protein GE09DRAFT_697666 [Coniochaeta sp. 2T2.1]|nr:hypothetical protein GE09DRAFT_697666 [Coniochaeta sp. 2T2.1]
MLRYRKVGYRRAAALHRPRGLQVEVRFVFAFCAYFPCGPAVQTWSPGASMPRPALSVNGIYVSPCLDQTRRVRPQDTWRGASSLHDFDPRVLGPCGPQLSFCFPLPDLGRAYTHCSLGYTSRTIATTSSFPGISTFRIDSGRRLTNPLTTSSGPSAPSPTRQLI